MGKERESRDARANRKRMPRADRDVAAAEVRASVCVCVCVCVLVGAQAAAAAAEVGGGLGEARLRPRPSPPPLSRAPLRSRLPSSPSSAHPAPAHPPAPTDGRTDGRTSLHRRRPAPAAPPTPPPPRAAAAARPGEEAEAGRGGPAERWGGRREGGVSSGSCRRPPRPAETLGRGAGCRGGQPGVRGGEARLVSPFPSQNGAPDFPTSPYSCAWKGAAGEGRWW